MTAGNSLNVSMVDLPHSSSKNAQLIAQSDSSRHSTRSASLDPVLHINLSARLSKGLPSTYIAHFLLPWGRLRARAKVRRSPP